MKVAVSIPDTTFSEAEQLAQRLGTSRSEMYTRALQAFVREQKRREISESWNAVVDEIGDEDDCRDFVREAARQTLARTKW